MSIQIVMPRAGLTMVEGTISQWTVAEGSKVNRGDVIMEYENEKNTIEYKTLENGILHIIAKEGETIPVGGLIGQLAENQAEYDALLWNSDMLSEAPPSAPVAAAETVPAEGVVEITMPRAGLTMVEGTITEWKVTEGAQVTKGDVVMEYENEKNTIEYEIVHGGWLHIVAPAGETVKVGAPIAYVAGSKAAYDSIAAGNAIATDGAAAVVSVVSPTAVPAALVASRRSADGFVRASGLARKMAKEAGIEIGDVPPSGGDWTRVVAKDVAAYLETQKQKPTAAFALADEDEITATPWTGVRKVIARNMFNSLQQSAQCTSVCEVDVTELLKLRKELAEQQEFLGCKITVNDLLCMAMVKVLKKHPLINATFDGSTLYSHKHVNLTVAVATENGLMVPVVKHADAMTLTELSMVIKDLGSRARGRKLVDGEQSGGTFTVSNVGMFPTDFATPIINPPEVGIMGFGRSKTKPACVKGEIVPRDMMYTYLTFDHRVIDGLEVGRIQKDVQTLLENPILILA